MLKYKKVSITDIDSSKYVIAHCISTDCAMGKGVVVPICNKHPKLKLACKEYSYSRNRNVLGHAFRFKDKVGTVYNLFSKYDVRHKAGVGIPVNQYHEQLKSCLSNLKDQMIKNNEKYLAIPQIGCGLDLCKWEDVSAMIEDIFYNTDIEILVCLWK